MVLATFLGSHTLWMFTPHWWILLPEKWPKKCPHSATFFLVCLLHQMVVCDKCHEGVWPDFTINGHILFFTSTKNKIIIYHHQFVHLNIINTQDYSAAVANLLFLPSAISQKQNWQKKWQFSRLLFTPSTDGEQL